MAASGGYVYLTPGQRQVLAVLVQLGRADTSRSTHHGVVSGVCAAALSRMGFVRYVGYQTVEITDEGRAALNAR